MKVTLHCGPDQEEEIIIRCREMDENILKLVALANSTRKKLIGSVGKKMYVLDPDDVYYIESVDDRVFLYTKDRVCDCALRLYEIEREFAGSGLIRANKSTIVNLTFVSSLNPLLNGKIEVTLENGERQIISRQYAPALKDRLGIGR